MTKYKWMLEWCRQRGLSTNVASNWRNASIAYDKLLDTKKEALEKHSQNGRYRPPEAEESASEEAGLVTVCAGWALVAGLLIFIVALYIESQT